MGEIGLNTILTTPGQVGAGSSSTKIQDAAKQFESLLIEQMLKSARASGSGDWTGSSDDPTGSTMSEMAEQRFAQLLASNGGMGLAKLVVAGLERK